MRTGSARSSSLRAGTAITQHKPEMRNQCLKRSREGRCGTKETYPGVRRGGGSGAVHDNSHNNDHMVTQIARSTRFSGGCGLKMETILTHREISFGQGSKTAAHRCLAAAVTGSFTAMSTSVFVLSSSFYHGPRYHLFKLSVSSLHRETTERWACA